MRPDGEVPPVNLQRKALLFHGATLVVLVVVLYAIASTIYLHSFARLEQRSLIQDLDRVSKAISEKIRDLTATALDWAEWDDAYTFLKGSNPGFFKANLNSTTFENLRLDFLIYQDTLGRPIFASAYDSQEASLAELPGDDLEKLCRHKPDRHEGIIVLPHGPYLVVSRPVLTSEGQGPPAGSIILGRRLDEGEIGRLVEATELNLKIRRREDPSIDAGFREAAEHLGESAPHFLKPVDDQVIQAYAILNDIHGRPELLLRIEEPRDIHQLGLNSIIFLILASLLCALALMVASRMILERMILRRLSILSTGVKMIGASGDPDRRLAVDGNDELTDLSRSINGMLQDITSAHGELRKSAERLERINQAFLNFGTDPRANMQILTEVCGQILGADCTFLNCVDADLVRTVASWNAPEGTPASGRAEGLPCYQVVRSAKNEPLILPDLEKTPYALTSEIIAKNGFTSYVGNPVQCGKETIGALCGFFRGGYDPSEEDLKFLGILASAIGVQEANRKVQEGLLTRERYLQVLVDFERKILVAEGMESKKIPLRLLGEASSASRVYLVENHLDASGRLLARHRAEWTAQGIDPVIDNPFLQELPYEELGPGFRGSLEKGDSYQGLASEQPESLRNLLEVNDIRSILAVPIHLGGRFWGFLGLDDCRGDRKWDASEVALISSAASALSLAFEKEEAQQSLRTRNAKTIQYQTLLLELSHMEPLEFEHSKERITELAADALHVGRAGIWLLDSRGDTLRCEDLFVAADRSHGRIDPLKAQRYPAFFSALVASRTIAVTEPSRDEKMRELVRDYLEPQGIVSVLTVPIRLNAKVAGAVCFESVGAPRTWTAEEQDFGSSIADRVSISLEASGRKRALQELAESEFKFRALAETTTSGIIIYQDDRIVYANPAALRMAGLTEAEVIGAPPWKYLKPETEDPLRQQSEARLRGEHLPPGGELKIRTASGNEKWIDYTVGLSVLRGKPSGVITFADITARKRSEQIRSCTHQIALAANTSASLKELFVSIHKTVGELMHAPNFYIALWDAKSQMIRFAYFVDEFDPTPPPRPKGRSLTDYVLRTGQALLASPAVFQRLVDEGEVVGLGAPSIDWLGVPLRVEDRVLGVLVVQSYSEGVRYGEEEKSILEFVSYQVATTIERKASEESLRESERRLRDLLENVHLISVILDEAGAVTFCNEYLLSLTGWEKEEVLGRNWFDLMVPADIREATRGEFSDNLRAGSVPQHLEYEIVTRSGERRWILWNNTSLRAPDGTSSGIASIGEDFTERNMAEAELRESLSRFEAVIESTPGIAIQSYDREGVILLWNTASTQLYGLEAGQVIGRKMSDVLPSARQSETLLGAIGQIFETGQSVNAWERSFVLNDGRTAWVFSSVFPIFDHGAVSEAFCMEVNISKRKEAESALRLQTSYFQQLFENSPEGIAILNNEERILDSNMAFRTLFGFTAEEIAGASLNDLIVPQDRAEEGASLSADVMRGRVIHAEGVRRTRTGSPVAVDILGFPIMLDKAQIGIYAIYTDISVRKAAEEALRQSEKKFRALAETTTAAILIFQGEQVLYVNPATETISGFGHDQLLEMKIGDIVHEDYRSLVQELAEALGRGEPIFSRYEIRFVTREGEERWVDFSVGTIPYEGSDAVLCTALDITERKQAEQSLDHLAYYDTLTGLPNRLLFHQRFRQIVGIARSTDKMVALLFLDLDRFKEVNDTVGHEIGDLILQAVSRRLLACVGERDSVARMGSDEFTLLISELTSIDQVESLALWVQEKFSRPFQAAAHEFHITPSIGISVFPNDGEDVETLIKHADIAMYRAKSMGGNNCQFFLPEMGTIATEKVELQKGLRKALEDKALQVHFQPMFELGKCAVMATEALVRWRHKDHGWIPPDKFIPLAEEVGLIVPLGEFVLHTACSQNRAWLEAGLSPMRVAVNLSARQFNQNNLGKRIRQVVEATGLNPTLLELEITENTAMLDPDKSMIVLKELHQTGMRLAIDDFGKGYSSLNYLRKFPIHTLKIDKSFIRDVRKDAKSAAIVTAIVNMGHGLKLEVVAEGVETAEQFDYLRSIGCDVVQGFYLKYPSPAAEITEFLRSHGERSDSWP